MRSCLLLIAILILLMSLHADLHGQEGVRRPYLQIGYYGILGTHPGIKVGVQLPLLTLNQRSREERLNQLVAGVGAMWYVHRRNHRGLGFTAELGLQNREAGGMHKALFLGLGYLRKSLPRRIYDFDSGGDWQRLSRYGSGQLLKTLSIGLGGPLTGRADADFWMLRPTLLHINPFNFGTTLNFALDAGYHFR